ncbi:hypothetical protein [Bradyrhizobium sp. OAE829]|uniref:hypothetical protein n=1 Tax=Bradyrhizobium sp. OAE829 TaxID=2663807 RepID=UPI00178B88CC
MQVALVQVEQAPAVLERGLVVLELAVPAGLELELAEPVAQVGAEPVAVRLEAAAGIPHSTEPHPARRVHPEQARCRRIDRLERRTVSAIYLRPFASPFKWGMTNGR